MVIKVKNRYQKDFFFKKTLKGSAQKFEIVPSTDFSLLCEAVKTGSVASHTGHAVRSITCIRNKL